MKLTQAETEITRFKKAAAPGAELAQEILRRTAAYIGPIETPAGKDLWAIQACYVELGDEVLAERLLTANR